MASVLNRTTKEYLRSVSTGKYPVKDWIINPDLSNVDGVPRRYWKISGDSVQAMSSVEQATIDSNDRDVRLQATEDFLDERQSPQGAYNTLLFKEINRLRKLLNQPEYTLAQLKTAIRKEVGP